MTRRAVFLITICITLLAACTPTPNAPAVPKTLQATPAPLATLPATATTPQALPAAQEPPTASANCPPADVNGPEASRPDICIRKVMNLEGAFVRLRRNPVNGALFALNTEGEIYKITLDAAGTGTSAIAYTHAQIGGGSYTLGMAFGPDGALYVVGNDTKDKEGKCTLQKGVDGVWNTLAETEWFPLSGTNYDHRCNGVAVSPDNTHVFFNSGSRTEHGEVQENNTAFPGEREVPLTSVVFKLPVDAKNILLKNDEVALKAQGVYYADGLRNAFDMAFAPDGALLATENGPDADFPEELNTLVEGGHYGFPWRFGNEDNPQRAPDFDPAKDKRLHPDFYAVQQRMYRNDPTFPAPPAVTFTDPIVNLGPNANQKRSETGELWAEVITTFTPHRSPLGLVFDTAGALSGEFKNSGFVLSWGSAGGDIPDRGEDLLHLQFSAPNQLRATRIIRGFQRPIDATLSGKTLYVLENNGSAGVWEVTLP